MSAAQPFVTLESGLQFLAYNQAEIALDYQCESPHPTHLLILVNGFQRNRLDFRAFRKKLGKLAPHVATVSFDNRYCGQTKVEENSEFSLDIMAKDASFVAEIFMKKLGLSHFSMLGISMGGMISQRVALTCNPGQLDNLFLVSTTSGGKGRTWPRPVENPNELKFEDRNVDLESTKKNMSRYFAERFLKQSPLLFEMMCKNILSARSENSEEMENNASTKQFDASKSFDEFQSLNQISAKKTIVVSGDEDKIIPYENAITLKQNIPNSQLITYTNVGHLILIEEPERFVQDVASFF